MTDQIEISRIPTPELETYLIKLGNIATEYADILVEAESEFKYLEDMEKICFDSEMPDVGEEKVSIRDREKVARTSLNFKQHIEAMKVARHNFLQAKYKYENAVRKHDDVQSILLKRFGSTPRQEKF